MTWRHKKNRLLFCGFHPHPPSPVLYCVRVTYFFGSKLEDNDPIMLGLIQLGADTCRVSDPDFRGAALGCWGWVAW